jgi:hypothetical protein
MFTRTRIRENSTIPGLKLTLAGIMTLMPWKTRLDFNVEIREVTVDPLVIVTQKMTRIMQPNPSRNNRRLKWTRKRCAGQS